jgi:hypothetical protein
MRALLLLALASCTHDLAVFDRIDVQPARDLDILYVFDNSAARGNYDAMASQLGELAAQLASVDGRLPSLHVGVVTTDLGTRGRLDTRPAAAVGHCAGDGDAGQLVALDGGLAFGGFLEDLRGPGDTRVRNFDGDLAGALGRLTNPPPGTANTGCDFPQAMEAMRRALDPATNPDFLRPDAMLSVVFLTDQDDCSLARGAMLDPANAALGPPFAFRCTEQGVICDPDDPRRPGSHGNCRPRDGSPFMIDVADYQRFLAQLKPDPRDVVVSAVAGPRTAFEVVDVGVPALLPSCHGPGGSAMPAVRIGALVDRFGGALVDGCTQDDAYQQIAVPILGRQRSCFPHLRPSDGDRCTVTETAGGVATELAPCGDGEGGEGGTPCWTTYTDPAACPGGDHVGIAIRRAAAAPAGAQVQATCFAR